MQAGYTYEEAHGDQSEKKKAKNAKKEKHGKKKGAAAKAKGASKGTASNKSADQPKKKKKRLSMAEAEADFLANCPPGQEHRYKLFAKKEMAKAEKKRAHSKAYHSALSLARNQGKGIEEAKDAARKAGQAAAAAWEKNKPKD